MGDGLLTNSGSKAVCDPEGQGGESDHADALSASKPTYRTRPSFESTDESTD